MRIYLLLGVVALIFSCTKDSIDRTTPPVTTPDSILYYDFQPDTTLHSVRYFDINLDPESCGNTPYPSDSTVSLSIDMDGDSVNDFTIHVRHYTSSPATIHCWPVIFEITMRGINAGDSIRKIHPHHVDVPENFDFGDTIDQGGLWASYAYLSLRSQGTNYPPSADFTASYVAIKINNQYGYVHFAPASLNGVAILEYGLNLTDSNSITAGQTH